MKIAFKVNGYEIDLDKKLLINYIALYE